jgi:hypothetical protein
VKKGENKMYTSYTDWVLIVVKWGVILGLWVRDRIGMCVQMIDGALRCVRLKLANIRALGICTHCTHCTQILSFSFSRGLATHVSVGALKRMCTFINHDKFSQNLACFPGIFEPQCTSKQWHKAGAIPQRKEDYHGERCQDYHESRPQAATRYSDHLPRGPPD